MKNRIRLIALMCALGLTTLTMPVTAMAATQATQDVVRIKTNMGSFDVRLDAKRAPVTVRNFLNYANKGFYNGTIFHRVIDGFMIQGGGFTADMKQKETDDKIINEARTTESNRRGTISIVKTQTKGFYENVPVTPVVIESVTVLNAKVK